MIGRKIAIIILSILFITPTIFTSYNISKADSIDKQIKPAMEQKYTTNINNDIFGPFEFQTSLTYYPESIIQAGISSNDNGTFFISTAWVNTGKIKVAKRATLHTFRQTNISGINNLNIGWHVGDPFCDDNYLIVPKSNWNFYNPVPDIAQCRVYYLNNLSELPRSPYGLKKYGKYIPGASSGAFYEGGYYFSTYNEGIRKDSKIYKFSFNPNIGFSYEETHSLGTTEIQGIDIFDNKCYFIRTHGGDPHVYWIDMNTWDKNNIGKQNLQLLSNKENGPFEGITFDKSKEGKVIAYFGFGGDNFVSFIHTNNFEFSDLDCSGSIELENIKPNANVSGEFKLKNNGDLNTYLNWEISDFPEWGEWSFNPKEGENLTPEDGEIPVNVNVVIPDKKKSFFEGKITITNKDNIYDYCTINVVASTAKQKSLVINQILNNYPLLSKIIKDLLN